MNHTTKDGIEVVEDGWPTYVRVIEVPRWLARAWVVSTILTLLLLGGAIYQTTLRRSEAHEDADRIVRAVMSK